MKSYIGFDIGGTKMAAARYLEDGTLCAEAMIPTPPDYDSFLAGCCDLLAKVRDDSDGDCKVGLSTAGAVQSKAGTVITANILYLNAHNIRDDLQLKMGCAVRLANDADCLALAEAVDGAGADASSVMGLILGTGVGGGIIHNKKIMNGPNGLAGEIGHIPLTMYEEGDGPLIECGCGLKGCIETFIPGPALSRLYNRMTGLKADPREINALSVAGDAQALAVLDRYYEIVAKALIAPLYAYDPEVIVVAGGMRAFAGLYTEVPKRMEKYSVVKNLKTQIKPAVHGPMAGLRGAAWLWRD